MSDDLLRVILAAGAGSRMGAVKALLDLEGRTALERIARLELPGYRLDTIVVVGHAAEAVRAEAARLGLETVENHDWRAGQTGSLRRGLEAIGPRGRYLLHPVDLPLVARSSYEALARALDDLDPDDQETILVPSHERRRGHPLIFGAGLRRLVLAAGPDRSLRDLVASSGFRIRHVEVDDPQIRRDLDHPEDLAAARAYLRSRGPSTSP